MPIYLDHNATTPLRPEVWEAMQRIEFGPEDHRNPSSVHRSGIVAARAISAAREQIASAIEADPKEIVFTGGGSEAINTAIKGAVWASERDRPHIVTSAAEHHAVLHAAEWLGSTGAALTVVPVDRRCRIDPAGIAEAITPDTVLVSVKPSVSWPLTWEPCSVTSSPARPTSSAALRVWDSSTCGRGRRSCR
jgi:cysteine desulfurase